jgi:hypothetical protein
MTLAAAAQSGTATYKTGTAVSSLQSIYTVYNSIEIRYPPRISINVPAVYKERCRHGERKRLSSRGIYTKKRTRDERKKRKEKRESSRPPSMSPNNNHIVKGIGAYIGKKKKGSWK